MPITSGREIDRSQLTSIAHRLPFDDRVQVPKSLPKLRNLPLVCGFDRVIFWVDTPELPFELDSLCCKATSHLQAMRFHPNMQVKVDVHQPSRSDLHALAELESRCHVQLSYAECALDIKPRSGITTVEIAAHVLGHCIPLSVRNAITKDSGTYYSDHHETSRILALYYDRPSKLADWSSPPGKEACFHMEWRFKGKESLQQNRLVTLTDLADFDVYTFWKETLHSFSYTDLELGRQIIERAKSPSAGLPKSASPKSPSYVSGCWKREFSTEGIFCAQNAWVDPEGKAVLKALKSSDLWSLLGKLDTRITRKKLDASRAAPSDLDRPKLSSQTSKATRRSI